MISFWNFFTTIFSPLIPILLKYGTKVLDLVLQAEKTDLTGPQKKQFVIDGIKDIMPDQYDWIIDTTVGILNVTIWKRV